METEKMSWSEERIALLTELWAEGLSASKIAGRLGDISRNAVIGKVHRIGLPGRKTTSRKRKPRPPQAGGRAISRPASPRSDQPVCSVLGPLALKPNAQPTPSPKPLLQIVRQPNELPDAAPGVKLLDLEENMCRWPKGDPKDSNFQFCGRRNAEGLSYCAHHARQAFKPQYWRIQGE
jgi:GcrA cell cycle regulator